MSTDLTTILKDAKTVAQFKLALPSHINADRFARAALTTCLENPDLAKCTQISVLSCLIQVAQLGLELGKNLGQAYLIPYRNNKTGTFECTLIVGYKGLLALARRSGDIKRISTGCVYDGDKFDFALGTIEYLNHCPGGNTSPAAITHVYAIAELKSGGMQIEVMTRQQVDAIKNRGRQNPVWNTDYAEMARKTAFRRIAKMLPLSPELADAIRHDGEDDLMLPEQPNPAKRAEVLAEAAADDRAKYAQIEAAAEAKAAAIDTPN